MAMNIGPDAQDDEPQALSEINTTPLIDVMLVLLIMLIITIPIQTHAVKLDLPSSAAQDAPPPAAVTVEVEADGTILWNHQPVDGRPALDAKMQEASAMAVQPELHLKPNGQAPYAQVATVLAAAQRNHIVKLGIVGGGKDPG